MSHSAGVLVLVSVGVSVDVGVLVNVGVSVDVGVPVKVGVFVEVNVGVSVDVCVLVNVGVLVPVRVGVSVDVEVLVNVGVKVGVGVGGNSFPSKSHCGACVGVTVGVGVAVLSLSHDVAVKIITDGKPSPKTSQPSVGSSFDLNEFLYPKKSPSDCNLFVDMFQYSSSVQKINFSEFISL